MKIKASERMGSSDGHFLASQQEAIKKLTTAGHNVINLERGNPDLPTFPSILKAFEKAALNPINHGYPPYGGKDSLKKAIISFYQQEYGASLTMDEITIFSGSLSVLTALPMALVNPGEAVLTPNPSFFGYQTGIHMAGGKSISMDLKEENNYLPNLDDFTSENLEQAKLMFLNYPHNPTNDLC